MFSFRIGSTNWGNAQAWIGLSGATVAQIGADGGENLSSRSFVGFRGTAANANWGLYSQAGGVTISTNFGSVAIGTSSTNTFQLQFISTNAVLNSVIGYIDGVPIATNQVALPSVGLEETICIRTTENVAKGLVFYFFYGEQDP